MLFSSKLIKEIGKCSKACSMHWAHSSSNYIFW